MKASHEVLREAAERVGVKLLAAELRVSTALVYKWCEEAEADDPDASGTRNPLDRLHQIVQVTKDIGAVTWLCHKSGGFFVHNPAEASRDIEHDLLQSTRQLVQAFSSLLNEVSESVADDGSITPDEAARIRANWESLKTTAETFVVAGERGIYTKRKQK